MNSPITFVCDYASAAAVCVPNKAHGVSAKRQYVTSSRVALRDDDFGSRTADVYITCEVGEAPRITIAGSRLTMAEFAGLYDRSQVAIETLHVPCACGRPFFEHGATSPHALGECRAFTAAAPEWRP